MTAEQLQQLIAAGLPCEHIEVTGDGRHWAAVIVSPAFEGLRLIQRHQRVYGSPTAHREAETAKAHRG